MHVDPLDPQQNWQWYFHEDDTVDVAVRPFFADLRVVDCRTFPTNLFYLQGSHEEIVGVGDRTNTIGLFRHLSGEGQNLPIVHSGSIAAMPSDERVPVDDWDKEQDRKKIEAYLVEQQSLGGLSGSPVFVRPTFVLGRHPTTTGHVDLMVGHNKMFLLGIWHGAWQAPPDNILSMETGRRALVPVGIGVVVPAQKIKEVLGLPELEKQRSELRRALEEEKRPKPQGYEVPRSQDHEAQQDGDDVLSKMLNTPPKPRD